MKDVFARQELERYLERASLLARPGALIGCAPVSYTHLKTPVYQMTIFRKPLNTVL